MNYPMTLEQYISQAPLPERELVSMGMQIAETLAAIHTQGMVHGDVKPGKVLVLGDGSYRLIGMEAESSYPPGNIPSAAAPELSTGASYSAATDIYALGMMMLSLLPKQGVSAVLEEMIQKACERDPEKRYSTASEFASELEMMFEILSGESNVIGRNDMEMQPQNYVQSAMNNPNAQPGMQNSGMTNLNRQPGMQNPGMMNPNRQPGMQNSGMTNPNRQPGMQNAGMMNPNRQPGMQNPGMMNPNVQPGMQNPGMMNPNRQPGMQNAGMMNQNAQPGRNRQGNYAPQEDKKASLTLRFLLPILIVLVIAAAAIAYVVLIKPSMDEDKEMQTTAVESESSEAESTQNQTTEQTKEVEVPDIIGKDEKEATTLLEQAGLSVKVEKETSDTVEEGKVIAQSVAAGTKLAEQSEVVLTVSEGNGCPYEYSQKVEVTAGPGSSNGTMTLYNWENGDWVSKFSCACVAGKNGIGSNYGEGQGVTPLGDFKLGFVLGTSDPQNGMVFKQASSSLGVVDDPDSSKYNTLVNKDQVGDVSVDPVGENIVSGKLSCVIYIEHNGNGLTSDNVVPGKGSVITICGNNRDITATAGCVDISSSNMSSLLSLLDGTKNPHIVFSVK